MKRRSFRTIWGLLAALLLLAAAGPAQGIYLVNDGSATTDAAGDYAWVQFSDAPLASYTGSISDYPATRPEKGHKLDLNAPAANKYGDRLQAQRENYKKWLAKQAPQVQVVTEYAVTFNGLGVRLNGASLKDIQGGPGAVAAGMSESYRPAMNASHSLIGDAAVWTALGGQDGAGAGIKVGVIDTGIDNTHPFLSDAGFAMPAGFPKGQVQYTSNKVIVAKVFAQDPWLDARAAQSHGTHVSGTIAGRAGTIAPLAGGLSGVAPGAWLGSYNVFPGNVDNAKSLFIAKAVEEAVSDGMDVLNLSLGGTAHRGKDLLEMAVDAAADAGVVVAIAAGNEGPGNYTVGSPGTAGNVITVAAITSSRTFAMTLEAAALAGPALATTGSGNGEVKADITGEYAAWANYGADSLACTPLAGTPLAGKIALIQRGVCTFSTKINNAGAAGAKAVIIYQRNDVSGPPIPMATDGVHTPAIMISRDEGKALAAWTGDHTVTIHAAISAVPVTPNLLADFSSRGPTPNYTLKPDVAAPGVNILSSVPGGGFEVFQGTSMATPHVAGAAALLLAYSKAHSLGWGPAEVKAALMATAHDAADSADPLQVGAGIIDLSRAMNPPALAMPSSLSFELVRPVGNQTNAITFTLANPTNGAQTYTLAEAGGNLALNAATVTVNGGQSAQITATVANRGVHKEPNQSGTPELVRGYVTVTSAAGSIRIPYLYVIDYNR